MMDQHRSEYFAIPSEAFHPAFFSSADRLGCPEQRDCNGLILFGCVAIAERAIVPVYPESSLDHDSPQKRTLQVEDSTAEIYRHCPNATSGIRCIRIRESMIFCYCHEDAMARAVITTDFASPAETAQVLGVSRANREKLVQMAELAISRTGNRRGKAKNNGARTISRRARKRR